MNKIEIVALPEDSGQRIDSFLTHQCLLSRSVAQRLIQEGHVCVNGIPCVKSYRILAGDRLYITIPPPRDSELLPQNIPLEILYEDKHLLVVNKPKGMVVHPAAGNPDGTLVNALLYHCKGGLSGIGGEIRPGIVHRIDKDTSGLLVVAKDDDTHHGLAEQFAAHSITREYQAVVYGGFKDETGEIDAPIGRSRTDRKKMTVTTQNAKHAITRYHVLHSYSGFTHLALRLLTGRTHQIRVHMANIGHPLAGDAVYGPKKCIAWLHGQCLHAATLGFEHPVLKQYLEFKSPLPEYFTQFLHKLEKEANV